MLLLVSDSFILLKMDPRCWAINPHGLRKNTQQISPFSVYEDEFAIPANEQQIFNFSLATAFVNISEALSSHGMTSCDSVGTPMATKHLDADLSGTPIDQTKYHSMVGALMYLTVSRPDIMHAKCYCARYQSKLTEKHLTAVKQIFRYLKDTIHMGLWYPKDTGFELTAFLDLDHAGCLDSRKSTSGGIQFLGGDKLVSWSSKKQDCTLMSFVEADHSHIVQSSPAFAYQAHRRQISLHQRKERFKYLVRRLGMRCLTPEELGALPLVDGDVEEGGVLSLESMEDEEVAMVDRVFESVFGALFWWNYVDSWSFGRFRGGSFDGSHESNGG
nr:ribonuclease H-like domain-containing protein [Tanacetum cinerariifolium]